MRSSLLFVTLLLSSSVLVLKASSFTNGSFEINTGGACNAASGSFSTPGAGATCITGWTVGGGTVDYINNYWMAADGTYSLDMNGNSGIGSFVQQTFDTVAGTLYQVTFSLAGNPDGNTPAIKTLRVDAAGQSQNYSFDVTGLTRTNMGWLPETFSFTATGASTTLAFTSTTLSSNSGPALDNVSISAVGAVPEPATLSLLAGAGILVAALRRRKIA